jgi:FAD synthetase
MKKIMVFGTFAILHPGHLYFFRQAKKYGDYLVVVLGRDSTVQKIKGRKPGMDEKARREIVESIRDVNKAVLGDKFDWYKLIIKYKPAVICLGYDQITPDNFEEELRSRGVTAKIFRLKAYRPKKYKSSLIACSV